MTNVALLSKTERLEKLAYLRARRLENTSTHELQRLNRKLVGKGPHWLTQQRSDVVKEYGKKLAKLLEVLDPEGYKNKAS